MEGGVRHWMGGGGGEWGAWVRFWVRRDWRRGGGCVREVGERKKAEGGWWKGGGMVWGVAAGVEGGGWEGVPMVWPSGVWMVRGRVKAARSRASGKGWTMMSDEGCSHAWKREEECPSSVVWQLKIFCPALKRPCVTKANRHSGQI